ncbi:HAD-like domain protein [Vibrio phage 1.139.A._10N.261.48.C6]|nr:HAD-like domain protein [Vibrio phage 1.139.A._10N.261.48.C6]AUR90236.1 HAD-like domain protein [Vibrio phage 1.139.B._10N.261.48.C6]
MSYLQKALDEFNFHVERSNMKGNHYGIDFDDTITSDTRLWAIIIKEMIKHGHKVSIITYRSPESQSSNIDIDQFLRRVPYGVTAYYTDRKSKYGYALKHELNIDIWIDDQPFFVCYDMPKAIGERDRQIKRTLGEDHE